MTAAGNLFGGAGFSTRRVLAPRLFRPFRPRSRGRDVPGPSPRVPGHPSPNPPPARPLPQPHPPREWVMVPGCRRCSRWSATARPPPIWTGSGTGRPTRRSPSEAAGRPNGSRTFSRKRHQDATTIYSSPLARARDTAGAITSQLGIPLVIDRDLAEYHLGSWEGLSYADLHQKHRLWDRDQGRRRLRAARRRVAAERGGSVHGLAAAHHGEVTRASA